MKIALVILHADPQRGGAERYTFDLANSLSQRNHEVSLLSSSFPDLPPQIKKIPLPIPPSSKLRQYQHFLHSVHSHTSTTPYDIVHAMLPIRGPCHLYHPHAGLAAESLSTGHLKYPRPLKSLLSATFNRLNRKRNHFARVEREMLTSPCPPTVLCLSDYVKQTVRRHYPLLPETRLATLFNAVDLRRFDPARNPNAGKSLRQQFSIPPDRILALIIAQDFARKGLRESILALAQLQSSPISLLVVGRDDPTPYQRLAHQLGLSDRILFAGPTADPYPFYQAADLFLLPTRHDPCSLVVLESLAMGLPVISTTSNGACEIMTDGLQGRILPNPSDIPALTNAIRHLLDEQTRRSAREASLSLRPQLSFDEHVNKLLHIYQQSSPPNH